MIYKRNTTFLLTLAGLLLFLPVIMVGADENEIEFSLEDLEGLTPDQYNDVVLEAFVQALIDVQDVQLNMNMDVESIMKEGELGPERFVKIHQIVDQGLETDGISESEIEAYKMTLSDISRIEQKAQMTMIEIVQDNGLTAEHYNLIIAYAQQDKEFMTRLQEFVDKVTG